MPSFRGSEPFPEQEELKLSTAFREGKTSSTLELTATVYNINPGHNEEIRKKSRALRDYSTLVAKVREYTNRGYSLEKAIERGVYYCIENGVMVEYLREHASEVTNMLYAEWDMDKALSVERVEGREEGRLETAARMKADGVDDALIAKYTGLAIEEIRKL